MLYLGEDSDSDGVVQQKTIKNVTKKNANKKNVEDIYQKKTQLEHVLLRPDSYIGSTEKHTGLQWVFEDGGMVNRQVTYVPGLYKIFDEILVNAADNKHRDPTMDTLKINIDQENNRISIWNNGKGIPVVMHQKEKMYVPELIFGHLLTSSNYDDDEKKVTGGRNGFGAKLCNIFSTEFTVETGEKESGKLFKQVYRNNMSERSEPEIKKGKKDFTCISFEPDLQRFHMTELDDDIVGLFTKRAYDMAGVLNGVKVYFNDERIQIKSFQQYIQLYLGKQSEEIPVLYEKISDRWEVCVTHSDGQFQQISFVNSIATTKGGTHVTHACDKIVSSLMDVVTKKNKAAPVKPFQVKNHLWVFVNCLIENPSFDSQTKENMTLRPKMFGSECHLSEKFVKAVVKSGVIDKILEWAKYKQQTQLSKQCSGVKRNRLTGIPKLDDANMAGTKQSGKCTLILTEGDSAKTLAVSGLSVIGRDLYGVFPLKGKMLNVREATHKQIMGNAEIQNIVTIMGLKYNHVYKDVSTLRYGSLMIMTDQDHDGSHIKGLLINFFHHFWPSLLKVPGFLIEFITPIVKVSKGKKQIPFFTIPEYQEWKENNNTNGWKIKYYKGLGTSSPAEAKEYFSDLPRHQISFEWSSDVDGDRIELAFSKKKADARKEWLGDYVPGTFLDQDVASLNYTDFIDKELILFSMADNMRSIPCIMDGLKPGQRKVLFACFKRNLKEEIKVAQLTGYVAEHSAYHHGEASLCMTIVNMAQDYVGSNNINLLQPLGSFGSRLMGGKDASSPRYINTNLNPIARMVFPIHDDNVLNTLVDDGQAIEPEWYCPVIPMVLVNGSEGIGTGWRTSISNHNPLDLVDNVKRMLNGEEPIPMQPYYANYEGVIDDDDDKFRTYGTLKKIDESTLQITELPIRSWTTSYKEFLDELSGADKPFIKDFKEYHTDTKVNFVLTVDDNTMDLVDSMDGQIHKKLKLESSFSKNNYVLFDHEGRIRKYSSTTEILKEFFDIRLDLYRKRKEFLVDLYTKDYEKLNNKVRFIKAIISGDIVINNKRKDLLITELSSKRYMKVTKSSENEDSNGYDYLLSMPLWNLTAEKVEKLENEKLKKEEELDEILNTSVKQMWMKDLDVFKEGYTTHFLNKPAEETAKTANSAGKIKGKAKGRAVKMVSRELEGYVIPIDLTQNKVAPKGKSAAMSNVKEEVEDNPFSRKAETKPTSSKAASTKASKPTTTKRTYTTTKVKKESKPVGGMAGSSMDLDSDSDGDPEVLSLAQRLAKSSLGSKQTESTSAFGRKPSTFERKITDVSAAQSKSRTKKVTAKIAESESESESESQSDSDYAPKKVSAKKPAVTKSKPAAKPKAAAKRPVTKPAAKLAAKPAAKPATKPATKPVATKKKAILIDSDSEVECMDISPVAPRAAGRGRATKAPVKYFDSEGSESESELCDSDDVYEVSD